MESLCFVTKDGRWKMFRLFAVCHRVSNNNVFAGKYRQTDALREDTDRQTAPQEIDWL